MSRRIYLEMNKMKSHKWQIICIKDKSFSNSLVIHEEKTKEITTVKEVWICDPNYHKIR